MIRMFKLNRVNLALIRRHGYSLCDYCGKDLEIGEVIISKTRCRNRVKHFHVECYESMFIEA